MRKSKNSGLSIAATAPVSLKVLSWNVAGLAEDCTDIFLSQISMLVDWDVLLLQECFRKLDGVDVGVHELFTPSELLRGLRCPAVIVNRKWKGQSKIVGGAARWTAVELDGQLTFISAHLPHKGSKLGEFEATLTEIQEFVSGRPKQHVILGGDFNVSLYGMTDYLHVGESIPRPRTLVDTNDSLRARAFHTMATELDLTVTNTWMNADTERELFTRSSWSNPEDYPHAIHDERFSLIFTYLPFYFNLSFLVFFHSSVLMHPDLHTDLDNLDSVENNLRHSAKGSLDAYDFTASLTGYEPNDTVSNELGNSQGPFAYVTPSSDQDIDDTTLGKLLTEAHREYADYLSLEGVFVSQSSLSVASDRTGKPVGKSNLDPFSFGVRNAYSAHNQFPAITQAEKMVDRTGKPVGESSSSAQIRTLFDDRDK